MLIVLIFASFFSFVLNANEVQRIKGDARNAVFSRPGSAASTPPTPATPVGPSSGVSTPKQGLNPRLQSYFSGSENEKAVNDKVVLAPLNHAQKAYLENLQTIDFELLLGWIFEQFHLNNLDSIYKECAQLKHNKFTALIKKGLVSQEQIVQALNSLNLPILQFNNLISQYLTKNEFVNDRILKNLCACHVLARRNKNLSVDWGAVVPRKSQLENVDVMKVAIFKILENPEHYLDQKNKKLVKVLSKLKQKCAESNHETFSLVTKEWFEKHAVETDKIKADWCLCRILTGQKAYNKGSMQIVGDTLQRINSGFSAEDIIKERTKAKQKGCCTIS